MDRRPTEAGHLVVFDRSEDKPWEEKVFRRDECLHDRTITVWRCDAGVPVAEDDPES